MKEDNFLSKVNCGFFSGLKEGYNNDHYILMVNVLNHVGQRYPGIFMEQDTLLSR